MGVNEQSAFNALVEKYYKEMQEIQSNRSITESVRDNKIDALQRKYQDQFSYFGTSILCNAGEELGEDDGLLDSDPVPLTSELREFIQRYTQKLKQINVIKESTIHRSCIVCGETIKGLGLTDMSDAGVSVCWNCSDEHAYMDHPIYLYTDTKFTYHDIILFNDICTNLMNHPEMNSTMEEVINYGMSLSCNLELYALCIHEGHIPTASEWKFLTKLQNETRFTRWEDRPDTKSFVKLIQYFDKFPYKYNVYQHLRTRYAIDMFAKCVDSGFNEDEILDVYMCSTVTE